MRPQETGGRLRFHVAKGTLGTFAGVFTPSVLTILGIILFLRLGYVVGSAGLVRALLIVALANTISVLTSFSLSAIATNLKVKGGGDYYLISRTLGTQFGGSIGIVLFLAQSVSIAFYCIGFGEALTGMLQGHSTFLPQVIAACAVSFLFVFAWLGADWATRFQYVVMAILAAALLSFFGGGLVKWDTATLVRNWASSGTGLNFWVIFAIFFPAVTGFTQGVSMSGDLKDPGKSLPLGTFLAVGVSILVYFGAAVVFGATMPGEVLAGDYGAMKRVAYVNFLIDAGVIAATLSSAMASFLGAPRILQSMARDRIFPFLLPFGQGVGPTENPRRGVLLSAGIAYATIAFGNLNLIASVVTMFFLISYGLLNYATFYEARTSSPSFRPRFRWFDYRISLLGWLACLGVMLAIDLVAGAVAISVLFAIYQYLRRTAGPARWADSRRSYHLQHLREHLVAAAAEPEHPRDWRPQILAVSNDAHRRAQLLRFSSWLEGGSGLTTVVKVLEGEGVKMHKLKGEAEKELTEDIRQNGLTAFPLVVTASNIYAGMNLLVQAFGIGPLHANMVLLNRHDQFTKGILSIRERSYARLLSDAFHRGCNVVVLNSNEDGWPSRETLLPQDRRIDVWWWADATGSLMLLLAYLMTRNEDWEGAKIRVLAFKNDQEPEQAMEDLRQVLEQGRIEAEPVIVETFGTSAVTEHSADATLVFFPFHIKGSQLVDALGDGVDELLSRLPVMALVLAAEDIDLDAEPEEGKAGELAAALDAAADAEKKAREADAEAERTAKEAEEKMDALQALLAKGADETTMSKVRETLEAKEQAGKAARRAAKARAKAEDAAREAESLGAKPPNGNKDTTETEKQ